MALAAARMTSVLVALLTWTGLVWGRAQVGCGSSPSCSLTCPGPSRVFLLSARYGHKLSNRNCLSGSQCGCCQYEPEEDCLREASPSSLSLLVKDCLNTSSCPARLPSDAGNCSSSHSSDFSYVRFQYACVNDSQIQNFNSSGSRDAEEAGVLQYTDSGASSDAASWHCLVEAADCSPLPATVLLHLNATRSSAQNCSTLAVGDEVMSCNDTTESRNVTLPVNVTLRQAAAHRNFTAWAVVRANDGSRIRISCGHDASNPSSSGACAGGETTTPGSTAAAAKGGDYLAAAVVGWVFAVLTSVSTGVLLLLFLRREGKCPQLFDFFQRRRRVPDPLPPPDTYDDPAPTQARNSADVGRSRDAGGAATNDGFYMDMEGSQEAKPKPKPKGGNSRQSSAPAAAKAVDEEEYSPLEPEPEAGETYSPLEHGEGEGKEGKDDDDDYQEMQTDDIYENA